MKPFKIGLAIFILIAFPAFILAQEQITITTYYPSPVGSYDELRANKVAVSPTRPMPTTNGTLVWGDGRGTLSPDEGASIELGGTGGHPYIDFSNDATSDYDFRLSLDSNDIFIIEGGNTYFQADDHSPSYIKVKGVVFCCQ